jgi:hypothetical protein
VKRSLRTRRGDQGADDDQGGQFVATRIELIEQVAARGTPSSGNEVLWDLSDAEKREAENSATSRRRAELNGGKR